MLINLCKTNTKRRLSLASRSPHKTLNPNVGCVRNVGSFRLSDNLEDETRFVWDGKYTYIYTDPESYEPLAQVHDWSTEGGESRQQTYYFHCDQIGIPREMTDDEGKLVSFLQKKMKILVVFSLIFPLKSGKRILNLKNLKTG